MLDIPQFVIDASKSSESERLKSLTESRSSAQSSGGSATITDDSPTDQPTSGGGAAGGSNGSGGSGGGVTNGGSNGDTTNGPTNNSTGNNTPAIVGGVVGGIAGLTLVILLTYFLVRRTLKCTLRSSSKKNTTNRMDKPEKKKDYKNILSRENHSKDSYESSSHTNDHTYNTPAPLPTRDLGVPPAHTSAGGLSRASNSNDRGQSPYSSTPNHTVPLGTAVQGSGSRDQGHSDSTQMSQPPPQQHDPTRPVNDQEQYPVAHTNPNPSLNPKLDAGVQQDRTSSNGNNGLTPAQGGVIAAAYQQPQQPPQPQHPTAHTDSSYTSTSVQATDYSSTTNSPPILAATGAFQQPQSTGSSSTWPFPSTTTPTTGTTATGATTTSSPPPQNFIITLNNYTHNHPADANGKDNSNPGNPSAAGYQQPQPTGGSVTTIATPAAPMTGPERSPNSQTPANSHAVGIAVSQRASMSASANESIRPGSMAAAAGYPQQPQLTGSSSTTATTVTANGVPAQSPRDLTSPRNSSTGNMAPRDYGPITANNDQPTLAGMTEVPQQPGFTDNATNNGSNDATPTPEALAPTAVEIAKGGAGAGVGSGADALAFAGVSLGISSTTLQQQQVQQQHHYHHTSNNYFPQRDSTGTTGGTAIALPGPQGQQSYSRYTDSGTMTTNPDSGPDSRDATAKTTTGGGYQQQQQQQQQSPYFTGSISLTSNMATSVDAGYQVSQATGSSSSMTTATGQRGGAEEAGYPQWQSTQFTGSTDTTMTTSPLSGAYTGKAGAHGGAWYRRPVEAPSDEPIELEANPAIRKVD